MKNLIERKLKIAQRLIGAILIFCIPDVRADYIAVSPIEGAVVGFFGGAKFYRIAWVQNAKGERWELPVRYASVDEYNVNIEKGYAMCFLKVKSSLPGVVGLALDAVSSIPIFYGVKKGSSSPEKISPEYLVFRCREVR